MTTRSVFKLSITTEDVTEILTWDGTYNGARSIICTVTGEEPQDLPEEMREEFVQDIIEKLRSEKEIELFGSTTSGTELVFYIRLLGERTIEVSNKHNIVEMMRCMAQGLIPNLK